MHTHFTRAQQRVDGNCARGLRFPSHLDRLLHGAGFPPRPCRVDQTAYLPNDTLNTQGLCMTLTHKGRLHGDYPP